MIKIILKKDHKGRVYISSENNIVFHKKSETCFGAQPYLVSYSRDCGPSTVNVVMVKHQAETILSLIYLCKENNLTLQVSAPSGAFLESGFISNEIFPKLYLALTEEDVVELYKEVELGVREVENQMKPNYI